MTALPERRRRLTATMFGATALALVVAPLLGYVGIRAVLDSTRGKDALADNLAITEFPSTPTAVLFTTNEAGELTSATAFALHPSGVGGSIVPVPVSADIGFADDARQSLQQVYASGGLESAHFAMESLLVMTVSVAGETDAAGLDTILGAAGAASADVGILTAGGADDGTELARMTEIEAFWADVAEAVDDGTGATVDTASPPTTFDDYATRLFAGPVATRGLLSTQLTGTANPDDLDVVEVDRAEVLLVFGSIAPGAVSAPSQGLKFRLESPPGYEAEVRRTIQKILFAGGNVLSVDMTKQPQPNTVFLVPDEINVQRASQTNLIFGDFEFQDPTVRISGIDLTVILGTEYLETVDA